MTSTNHDRGKKSLKFPHLFKKTSNNQSIADNSPKYRERAQSVPKHDENENNLKYKPNHYQSPQTTTGYATGSKTFAFNDEDDAITANSNSKSGHRQQNSLNLAANPLNNTAIGKHGVDASSVASLDNLMTEIESEKVSINVEDSEDENREKNDGSLSYSLDALQEDNAEFFPPGYAASSKLRAASQRRSHLGDPSLDRKYARRESNRKEIWRQMMQSVVNGIESLGANAKEKLFADDDDDDMDDSDSFNKDERKYTEDMDDMKGSLNGKKYQDIVRNTRLFRHNGYKIQRRFSSHELLRSRYDVKCHRRKNRPRSKSDPELLPNTNRFYRKLESEYRPGTMNIFMMQSGKKEKEKTIPTRSHQESMDFRFIFDDSDFEDDSFDEWSDNELDSILRTYDLEVPEPEIETKQNHNDNPNKPKLKNTNSDKLRKFTSMQSLKALGNYTQSLPGHIEKGIDKIKVISSEKMSKTPIKPYGGHVEASQSAIEDEFGSTMQHIKEYNVKKRNKLGRDKARICVIDIPLQVLRMKDTTGKTHKEHIVSSISDHAVVGDESSASQIIIKFYDNRDYFLTFESNEECIEFRNLIEKLRKFNLKMVSTRGANTSAFNHKSTMHPSMNVGNIANHQINNRDQRAASFNIKALTMARKPVPLTPSQTESTADHRNIVGFYDDDDEQSMSTSTHPTNGYQIVAPPSTNGKRPRLDTEMFEEATDDGNVYTGMQTSNVVYRIIKINKWGTKKERTMIVHKADRTVRLFDDKRRCHSEYPLKIMATLDIIDSKNVEVVFTLDQKPTQFVFRSNIDMWDFVEQIRTIAPNEIMVSDRRTSHLRKATTTTLAPKRPTYNKSPANTTDLLGINGGTDGVDADEMEQKLMDEAELELNPNVLRYSVLRLIRSAKTMGQQGVTWRQHRRCIYLDLEKRIVRMLTLGMHIKDYAFEDVLLLEKSYVNVNQLHMTCKHHSKMKEYWYEFVSPQARAEFVGRLLRALPGTKQSQSPLTKAMNGNHNASMMDDIAGTNQTKLDKNGGSKYKPQIDIYADVSLMPNGNSTPSPNPDVVTEKTLSPKHNKKKRRKRLSSEAIRGLMGTQQPAHDLATHHSIAKSTSAPSTTVGVSEFNKITTGDVLDVLGLEEHEMNGGISSATASPLASPEPPASTTQKNMRFTDDPLSIIVGSWNVSESEINHANLQMWIPPSKIEPHDIYVLGLQECAQGLRKQWISGLLRHIDSGRKEYVLLNKAWLMGIGIIIIVHRAHVCKISHLHSQVVPTGKGNIIGNKGATAISFQFQETSFVFINAHLAARAEKFEKRAKNFNRIIKNLELGRPGLDVLHQFTHTFFLGDLNYRITKPFYETVNMVKMKKWDELIKYDQLRMQMEENAVFYGFKEGEINFCPTYRWERNKNTISNKREQPPSYCDRILYKSLPQTYDLWQECYLSSHRCFGSDHRPVWSLFKFKPKMPYFTLPSHDNNNDEMEISDDNKNYKNINISLVELQASFNLFSKRMNKDKKNSKMQIHIDDEIDAILHYNYAKKPIRLKGGKYDMTTKVWRWPIEILDALRIKPFIPDPEFICRTHIYVCFVNVSKGNAIIGYAIISLFNAFPESLVDTTKLIKEYKSIAKQMTLMPSANHEIEVSDIESEMELKSQFVSNTQSGNKQFDIPVLLYGNCVGNLKGFVYADGAIVQRHRTITNMNMIRKFDGINNINHNNIQNNTNRASGLLHSMKGLKASARFLNVKK